LGEELCVIRIESYENADRMRFRITLLTKYNRWKPTTTNKALSMVPNGDRALALQAMAYMCLNKMEEAEYVMDMALKTGKPCHRCA
jgi:hypothetical protein